MLLEIDPEKCQDFVIREVCNKFSCAHTLKAMCGMLMASVFCCTEIMKDVKEEGYQVNQCNFCVAKKQ